MQSKKPNTQRRWHNDLLAVDFDPDATRCVRFKRAGATVSVVTAQILPAIDLSEGALKPRLCPADGLAKELRPRLLPLVVGSDAVVKLFEPAGQTGDEMHDKVRSTWALKAITSYSLPQGERAECQETGFWRLPCQRPWWWRPHASSLPAILCLYHWRLGGLLL